MNLWSTFLDLDKLHESTDDKWWTDQALDELKNKPKSEWTEDDWTLSQQEYEQLLQEYKENYSSYTQEEKDAINRAIGRYNGLLIRHGIEEAGDVLKELGERLPALIDGFMSAFEIDENQ
jgi:hypothetical protein